MLSVHPMTRLLVWLALLVGVQALSGVALAAAFALLPLAILEGVVVFRAVWGAQRPISRKGSGLTLSPGGFHGDRLRWSIRRSSWFNLIGGCFSIHHDSINGCASLPTRASADIVEAFMGSALCEQQSVQS